MSDILVFGGTGFLGRHLVPFLQARGHNVLSLGSAACDLRNPVTRTDLLQRKFERIYHLAAWTKAGDFCLYHKGEQWIVNQQINTHVLAYWQAHQPQALLVAMGTSCAYSPELRLSEENYLVGEPDKDLYTYAMTKRMLYCGQLALAAQFGMRWHHLIPSTLYGPRFELSDSHFIFDLIKKIHLGKTTGAPVRLWGDGHQVRELVYIEDVLRLIDRAVNGESGQLLNLASGEGHSIREFAAEICQLLDYDPEKIQYDTTAFTGVRRKVLSVDRVRELYPDFAFTPLREGLRATVADYLERCPA